MILPYSGPALETYEKIHALRTYKHNKLYPFKDTYYFLNNKGYLHILLLSAVKYNNTRSFYISDNLLTNNNQLREVKQFTKTYSTKNEAIEALKAIVSNQED